MSIDDLRHNPGEKLKQYWEEAIESVARRRVRRNIMQWLAVGICIAWYVAITIAAVQVNA